MSKNVEYDEIELRGKTVRVYKEPVEQGKCIRCGETIISRLETNLCDGCFDEIG